MVQDESFLVTAPPPKPVTRVSTTTSTTPASAATTTLNPAPVAAAATPSAIPAPAVTPVPALPQPDGPFTIRFTAQALTWMRIQADQQKSVDVLLRPGESYKHAATRTMAVRLGNAGGVSIYCNDALLGTAGKPGEVMNLQFPDAIKQLQQPPQRQ